jgi:hypothetical protein
VFLEHARMAFNEAILAHLGFHDSQVTRADSNATGAGFRRSLGFRFSKFSTAVLRLRAGKVGGVLLLTTGKSARGLVVYSSRRRPEIVGYNAISQSRSESWDRLPLSERRRFLFLPVCKSHCFTKESFMTAIRLLRHLIGGGTSLQRVADSCASHRSAVCVAELYGKASKRLRKSLSAYFGVPQAKLFVEVDTDAIATNVVALLNRKSSTTQPSEQKKAA